jgi:hypothetical protein
MQVYERAGGTNGVLGTGLGESGELDSTLQQLPSPLNQDYSLSLGPGDRGTLLLGVGQPSGPGEVTVPLQSLGAHTDGSPAWDDSNNDFCWVIDSSSPLCVFTILDSGAADTTFSGDQFSSITTHDGMLALGTSVLMTGPESSMLQSGPSIWTFRAGLVPGTNRVRLIQGGLPGHTRQISMALSGVAMFFHTTVIYQEASGAISILPR